MTPPELKIKPQTRKNALTMVVLGVAVCIVVLLVFALFPLPRSVMSVGVLIGLVIIGLGIAKNTEPEASLAISPQQISFLHRRGRWSLPWEDLQRFDIPRVYRGMELTDMPFLGIRLKSYDNFLNAISLRLAVHLMNEQRPLLVAALRYSEIAPDDYSVYFDTPNRWKSPSGQLHEGIRAGFAHRMECFRELLGYDLFISEASLDRDLTSFIDYLKELQQTRPLDSQ